MHTIFTWDRSSRARQICILRGALGFFDIFLLRVPYSFFGHVTNTSVA